MRVVLYTHDSMLTLARSAPEVVELCGQDYLDEYGVEIPDELAVELFETYRRLLELGAQLNGIEAGENK